MIVAVVTFAAVAIFVSPAHAQQTPAASGSQTPAPAASAAQTSPSAAKPPTASAPQSSSGTPQKLAATRAGGVYRNLKPTDGIDFAAYAESMEGTSGGGSFRPSGVLKRFMVVDINKNRQLTDLELADKHFVNGHIKTKLFGDILATSRNLFEFQFQATDSQIRRIRSFLAAQPAKPNAPQATAPAAQKTPAASTQKAARPRTGSLFLSSDKDRVSYAIGANIGKSLKRGDIDVDMDILSRAIQDALSGDVLLTDQEVQTTLNTLQADLRKNQELKQQQLAEANKKESDEFLAANKAKEGVVALPDGLQYKVLQEGTGPKPAASDSVTVNYRGTLVNGTEFDNSYKRGQPATFNVGQIIKGWTEALQLMPVGSKWQLFIPPDLAYGPQGNRGIAPNSALVFEVELVSIQPRPAPPAMPAPAPAQPSTPNAAPATAPNPAAPAPAQPAPKPAPTPAPPPTPTPTSKP